MRNKLRLVFVMAILILTVACAGLDRDPESRFSASQLREMGERFLAGGAHGQAIKYLTLAEQKSPKDPQTQHSLGRAYQERGLPEQALEHYKMAVTLKPDYSEAHNSLGVFYASRNEIFLAEDEFKKAIADPFNRRPHIPMFNLGLLYEGKGDTEMALKYYQDALRLSPKYGMAHYRMGLVLEEMKRADEAKAAYASAIDSNPKLVEAHFRFGVMSYTAGELENAFYSLNRVLKLAPYSTQAAEAKLYLNRLNSVVATDGAKSSRGQGGSRASEIEVLTGKDVVQKGIKSRQAIPETQFRVPPELQHTTQPAMSGQQQVVPPSTATIPLDADEEKKAQPSTPAAMASPSSRPAAHTHQEEDSLEAIKPEGTTESIAAPPVPKEPEDAKEATADAPPSEINAQASRPEVSNGPDVSGQQPVVDQPATREQPGPAPGATAADQSEMTSDTAAEAQSEESAKQAESSGRPGTQSRGQHAAQPAAQPGTQAEGQPGAQPGDQPAAKMGDHFQGQPAAQPHTQPATQQEAPAEPLIHEEQPGATPQLLTPEAPPSAAPQGDLSEAHPGGDSQSHKQDLKEPRTGVSSMLPAETARSGTKPVTSAHTLSATESQSSQSSDRLVNLPPPPRKPSPPQPVTPSDAVTQMQTTESSADIEQNSPGVAEDTTADQQVPPAESPSADGTAPETGATYIVQVGSFLERNNATRIQDRLKKRGLDPVVKPYSHNVLGTLYVVQLKPMSDAEKVRAIMTQLEKQENLKAILIKVR